MSVKRIAGSAGFAAIVVLFLAAAPAYAAGVHAPTAPAGDVLGIGHSVGGVFGGIGHAVLGAFSWTFGLASKFILVTLAALVKLLIPRSWASEGVQIMQWIVQVPNYAGKITGPAGRHVYGFAGINELRDLFTWIGVALLPLTLVYATSRAMVGNGDHVAIPIVRVLALGAVLVSYPYWWAQGAALVNQMTHAVLALPAVTSGLHKLMLYAVDGAALGGWQLIDLGLMAALGIELLGLIFLKVALVLLGALLYATGPVTIGLIPTEAGAAIARAWASAAITLLALPVVWAAVFAVGAVLINDAGTAGPLLAGNSQIGSLLGGVLLAITGLATLWLCLRAAREAVGLLRIQVGGLLALSHARTTAGASTVSKANVSAARSIRGFQTRISETKAPSPGASSGSSVTRLGRAGAVVATAGRRGVLGTAVAASRIGVTVGASGTAALIGRARAGAIAVQMARAGTASWQHPANVHSPSSQPQGSTERGSVDTPASSTANPTQPASHANGAPKIPRPSATTSTSTPVADTTTRPAPTPDVAPVGRGAEARNGTASHSASSAGASQPTPAAAGRDRPGRRASSRNLLRKKR